MPCAGIGGAVGEHVSQMGITFRTTDFYPNHAVGGVPNAGHPLSFNLLVKTGPTTASVKFGAVRKQRGVADLAVVIANSGLLVEFTGEGPFRPVSSQDPKFFGAQLADQIGVVKLSHDQSLLGG